MKQYHDCLRHIMDNGIDRNDRTGTGTRSVFGYQFRCDLSEGFPLLTTKKVFTRGIIHELLWFLRGDTNIRYLVQNKVNIWNEWPFQAYLEANNLTEKYPKYTEEWSEHMKEFIEEIREDEVFADTWWDLGPVYGYQWRNFNGEGVDQVQKVIDTLRNKPHDRRNLVVAYNPAQADDMALPPCHSLFQFYVADGKLSCQLYQRSVDSFLWLPFNIASYALLVEILANLCDLEVGDFIHTSGDLHIYSNHFEQVAEQLSRDTRPLPKLIIKRKLTSIEDIQFEDFEIEWYDPHPAIKAPIAV